MLTVNNGQTFEDGTVEPRHTIQINCPECGFDITADEIAAGECFDCGASFDKPAQGVTIVAASLPMSGGVM
jgi:ribosomal protein L37AE/L43A